MTAVVTEKLAAVDPRAGKYLTFSLGGEEFAIRVLKVREIIGIHDITAVPQTPAYIKGVINLRGRVLPVVDLRLKFGMPAREYTSRTCTIVVQVESASGMTMQTGVVVDDVSEVVNLSAADIEPAPNFGDGMSTPYILGLAKVKDRVKILLEIDQVLRDNDLSRLVGGAKCSNHGPFAVVSPYWL